MCAVMCLSCYSLNTTDKTTTLICLLLHALITPIQIIIAYFISILLKSHSKCYCNGLISILKLNPMSSSREIFYLSFFSFLFIFFSGRFLPLPYQVQLFFPVTTQRWGLLRVFLFRPITLRPIILVSGYLLSYDKIMWAWGNILVSPVSPFLLYQHL